MKIVKKFDAIGRIIIPSDIRNAQGWHNDSKIVIYQEGNRVILKSFQDNCFVCGGEVNLIPVREKFICFRCVDEFDA